jgi:hypothetical protein
MTAIKSAWDAAQGWRTLAFSLALVVFGFLETFDFTRVISDSQTAGFVTLVVGVVTALLRKQTTTSIGQKPE